MSCIMSAAKWICRKSRLNALIKTKNHTETKPCQLNESESKDIQEPYIPTDVLPIKIQGFSVRKCNECSYRNNRQDRDLLIEQYNDGNSSATIGNQNFCCFIANLESIKQKNFISVAKIQYKIQKLKEEKREHLEKIERLIQEVFSFAKEETLKKIETFADEKKKLSQANSSLKIENERLKGEISELIQAKSRFKIENDRLKDEIFISSQANFQLKEEIEVLKDEKIKLFKVNSPQKSSKSYYEWTIKNLEKKIRNIKLEYDFIFAELSQMRLERRHSSNIKANN